MPKYLQTPRFEVDYSTRLAQRQEALDRKIGKRFFWVLSPPPSPDNHDQTVGSYHLYRILYDELYGWEKRMLSDQEATLLALQGYRIKDHNPAAKFKQSINWFVKNSP